MTGPSMPCVATIVKRNVTSWYLESYFEEITCHLGKLKRLHDSSHFFLSFIALISCGYVVSFINGFLQERWEEVTSHDAGGKRAESTQCPWMPLWLSQQCPPGVPWRMEGSRGIGVGGVKVKKVEGKEWRESGRGEWRNEWGWKYRAEREIIGGSADWWLHKKNHQLHHAHF